MSKLEYYLNIQNNIMLSFRLRKTAQYLEKEESLYLLLKYPFKVIILDLRWKHVMDLLGERRFIRFEDIANLMDHNNPGRVEFFLNGLVRKGFLESRGYPDLFEYSSVSVIIPVRNRPEAISDCLKSLDKVEYPAEKLEIIVVDDASDDNTPNIVSEFKVRLFRLREHKQASFCRNLGAYNAQGEILAFLDSDCLADPSWLKEIVPVFNHPENSVAGGLVDSFYSEKGLDCYEKVKSSLNMGDWPKNSMDGDRFFYVPSCNLLVRKEIFLQLGGFNEDMHVGEDVDLCWRIVDQGGSVEYRPSGKIFHKHRNRVDAFCARRFDYGTSEPMLQFYHPNRIKNIIIPVPSSLFWIVLILGLWTGLFPLLIVCPIVLLCDSISKYTMLRQKGIPIHISHIILSTFRVYGSILYHLCAFVSRYYLFWVIPFLFLYPIISAWICCAHILVSTVEYMIKKPRLNFFRFLLFFSLEQLFYQLGVWYGCMKNRFFGPVNPRILRKPP